MHFDQDGTYNLVYIAEDECGNTTLAERVVEVATYRTVLYPDGTFIINEKSIDQASNEALHGGTATNVYAPFDPNGATDVDKYIFSSNASRPWNSVATTINSVEIGSAISPYSTAYWFASFTNCTSADLANLDTSRVTDMTYMFSTMNVITNLDVSGFDTSNVTKMAGTFYSCKGLTSLDLSNFVTSSVVDMNNLFSYCTSLTSLDLRNFDTSKVENMSGMFADCSSLTTLNISSFNTANVTDMSNMFRRDEVLASFDVTNFDTSKVTSMASMFYAVRPIEVLDLSSFNFLACESFRMMFTGMNNVTTIFVSSDFALKPNLPSYAGSYMFDSCNSLVGGAGTRYDSSATGISRAKIDGGTSNPGYFTAKA